MDYNDKYLKYKSKYLYLKKGGAAEAIPLDDIIKKTTNIFKDILKEHAFIRLEHKKYELKSYSEEEYELFYKGDNYTLKKGEIISSGSFGIVTECKLTNINTQKTEEIALKTIKIDHKKKDHEKSFIKELLNLEKINNICHTDIVCFTGYFMSPDKNIYCVMTESLIKKGMMTLENYMNSKKNNITPLDSLKIIRNISEAVKKLHDFDLVHLDIKKANIMINKETLGIKLLDFGLSCKDLNDKTDLINECSDIHGSNFNFAPEFSVKLENVNSQFFDRKRDWKKADIWTIGGIFYRLLKNGSYPPVYYESSSEKGKVALNFNDGAYFYINIQTPELELESNDKLTDNQNSAINKLVESALKKYPVDRPKIGDFIDEIDKVMELFPE